MRAMLRALMCRTRSLERCFPDESSSTAPKNYFPPLRFFSKNATISSAAAPNAAPVVSSIAFEFTPPTDVCEFDFDLLFRCNATSTLV